MRTTNISHTIKTAATKMEYNKMKSISSYILGNS